MSKTRTCNRATHGQSGCRGDVPHDRLASFVHRGKPLAPRLCGAICPRLRTPSYFDNIGTVHTAEYSDDARCADLQRNPVARSHHALEAPESA